MKRAYDPDVRLRDPDRSAPLQAVSLPNSPATLRDRLLAGIVSEAEAVAELEAIPGFNEAIAEAMAEARFWAKVRTSDGCWEWTAATKQGGYGMFHVPRTRRPILAHRYSYELANGPIPAGLQVCHRCDNPPCVRPDHLFLGTALDNAHDAISKGRKYGGSRPASNARIRQRTIERARVAHARVQAGERVPDIARDWGLDDWTINRWFHKYAAELA